MLESGPNDQNGPKQTQNASHQVQNRLKWPKMGSNGSDNCGRTASKWLKSGPKQAKMAQNSFIMTWIRLKTGQNGPEQLRNGFNQAQTGQNGPQKLQNGSNQAQTGQNAPKQPQNCSDPAQNSLNMARIRPKTGRNGQKQAQKLRVLWTDGRTEGLTFPYPYSG